MLVCIFCYLVCCFLKFLHSLACKICMLTSFSDSRDVFWRELDLCTWKYPTSSKRKLRDSWEMPAAVIYLPTPQFSSKEVQIVSISQPHFTLRRSLDLQPQNHSSRAIQCSPSSSWRWTSRHCCLHRRASPTLLPFYCPALCTSRAFHSSVQTFPICFWSSRRHPTAFRVHNYNNKIRTT
jgi:hypothetical protein